MKIEIDQSGRIEYTSKLTVVAYSNGVNKSLLITAKDKRKIQAIYRRIGQPRLFAQKVFAVAIFDLIKNNLGRIDEIIIDREYTGYDSLIKQLIFEVAKRNSKEIEKEMISFRSIGRKSNAHKIAWTAYKNKKTDIKLTAQDFFDLTFAK